MDDDARRRFYQSGESEIGPILSWFDTDFGARPADGTALDVGCGVGRLSYAMANVMSNVVGYDVSENMLCIAAEAAPANLSLTTQLPTVKCAWIHSYIVFQHIPPAEGLNLLGRCLDLAAADAFVSVQITGWRDGPPPPFSWRDRLRVWRIAASAPKRRRYGRSPHSNARHNFSEVLRCFAERVSVALVLRHTVHGRHHGAWFLARRD